MRIFLLWQRTTDVGRNLHPEDVAAKLREIFSPLFATPPDLDVRTLRPAAWVSPHLPVRGWKVPFVQENNASRVFAIDYPVTARRVLASRGIPLRDGAVLPAIAQTLQDEPKRTLQELAPPFSLIW